MTSGSEPSSFRRHNDVSPNCLLLDDASLAFSLTLTKYIIVKNLNLHRFSLICWLWYSTVSGLLEVIKIKGLKDVKYIQCTQVNGGENILVYIPQCGN